MLALPAFLCLYQDAVPYRILSRAAGGLLCHITVLNQDKF